MVDLDYEAIKEESISIAEAKEILNSIEEKTVEQKLAFEHAKKFGKLKLEKVKMLKEELNKLENRKLKEDIIVKLIDILPKTENEIKTLFSYSQAQLTDEEMKQVLDIILKYTK